VSRVGDIVWNDILPRSPVFTTGEVTELGGMDVRNVSRDLSRLAEDGRIVRIRRGLWAITGHPDFSPYAVVPHLFEEADAGYISFFTALNLHGLIEQIPQLIEVATRINKKSLETPVGTYEFHQLQDELYGGFEPADRRWSYLLATPEKAIFDALYISVRKGRQFARFPELEVNGGFSEQKLTDWIERIEDRRIRTAVVRRWKESSGEIDNSSGGGARALPSGD